jgi:hypothetical protein
MLSFQSIKEFIDAFWREDKLMTALFDKRNLRVRYDDALLFVEEKEERLEFLIQRSVILKNGEYIEFDSRYLDFFEDILDVNAEINISYIQENIENIKVNIAFYLEENSETRKYNYLRKIKSDIRKIGRTIIRNVIDLGRNIEDIYKTEPTYKIKIAKLERYDTKAGDVSKLIEITHGLIFEKEQLFFKVAMDEELKRIKDELRLNLHDGLNNLIEIQKQVIDYLNQIKRQDDFLIKLQKVKRLKDQFELKAKTNIKTVLEHLNPVTFEPNPVYSLKLSPEFLESEIALESIKKVHAKINNGIKLKLPVANEFSSDFLSPEIESEIIIDLDALKNGFAASGRDLFDYLMLYDYPKQLNFGQKVTIYCQLISLFPDVMNVTEAYALSNDIEYVMVYPKQAR